MAQSGQQLWSISVPMSRRRIGFSGSIRMVPISPHPTLPLPNLILASRPYPCRNWQHAISSLHGNGNLGWTTLSPQNARQRGQIRLLRRAGTQPSAAMAILLARQRCSLPGSSQSLYQICTGEDPMYVYSDPYPVPLTASKEANNSGNNQTPLNDTATKPSACTACLRSIFRANTRESQESISPARARENTL